MIFNYNGHAYKSGIYKILNTYYDPPRIYIGQTKEIEQRWAGDYKTDIPRGVGNVFLCNDYAKCFNILGHDDFLEFHIVEIMEESTEDERVIREEYYISQVYDCQNNCYNIERYPSAKNRTVWSYTPEESSKRRSNAVKKMWENKEIREKIISHRHRPEMKDAFYRNCHSPEAIKKIFDKLTKNHGKVISPNGDVFEVIGLRQFCIDHKIPLTSRQDIYKMTKGKLHSVHGWRKYEENLIGIEYRSKLMEDHFAAKTFKVASPEGIIFEGSNIRKFCKENNLSCVCMTRLILGKQSYHKGWVIPLEDGTIPFLKKRTAWNKGKSTSEEVKNKMSIAASKRKASDKTKKRMSDAQKKVDRKNIIVSDETRIKMSNAKKGKVPWNKGIKMNNI